MQKDGCSDVEDLANEGLGILSVSHRLLDERRQRPIDHEFANDHVLAFEGNRFVCPQWID